MILVIGGTGTIGSEVARQLAAAGQPLEGLIMGALGVDKIMLDMAPSVSPSI